MPIETGRSSASTELSTSARATSIQSRFGAATTTPSMSRTSPGTETPQPIRRRSSPSTALSSSWASSTATSAMVASTVTRSLDRASRALLTTEPSSATIVAPISSTKTSIARAPIDRSSIRTTGDGRPGRPSDSDGSSITRLSAASSPTSPAMALRVRPVALTSCDRDRGPRRRSSSSTSARFERRRCGVRAAADMGLHSTDTFVIVVNKRALGPRTPTDHDTGRATT